MILTVFNLAYMHSTVIQLFYGHRFNDVLQLDLISVIYVYSGCLNANKLLFVAFALMSLPFIVKT